MDHLQSKVNVHLLVLHQRDSVKMDHLQSKVNVQLPVLHQRDSVKMDHLQSKVNVQLPVTTPAGFCEDGSPAVEGQCTTTGYYTSRFL